MELIIVLIIMARLIADHNNTMHPQSAELRKLTFREVK